AGVISTRAAPAFQPSPAPAAVAASPATSQPTAAIRPMSSLPRDPLFDAIPPTPRGYPDRGPATTAGRGVGPAARAGPGDTGRGPGLGYASGVIAPRPRVGGGGVMRRSSSAAPAWSATVLIALAARGALAAPGGPSPDDEATLARQALEVAEAVLEHH